MRTKVVGTTGGSAGCTGGAPAVEDGAFRPRLRARKTLQFYEWLKAGSDTKPGWSCDGGKLPRWRRRQSPRSADGRRYQKTLGGGAGKKSVEESGRSELDVEQYRGPD